MTDERKIDRVAIDAAIEGVMELVCEICHYTYVEPSMEEVLTGQYAKCETCPIEAKVRELASLVETQVSMVFGYAIADSLREHFEKGVRNETADK